MEDINLLDDKQCISGSLPPHKDSFTKNYIAIDDISFTSSCQISKTQSSTTPIPIRTTANPCSKSGQFYCTKSKTCIDSTKVCNFHPDCGQNDDSDEHNCGNCDFERTGTDNVWCGWRDSGLAKDQWAIKSTTEMSKYSPVFPILDGSAKKGHYLIIDTSNGKLLEVV